MDKRANPGGVLPPDEIVGRDVLIADLWDLLQRHGVTITAERRIGKTSILNKMQAQPRPGMTVFYWSLENVRSPEELVQVIFNKISEVLGNSQKLPVSLFNCAALLAAAAGIGA
jgi:uncharacterized protein